MAEEDLKQKSSNLSWWRNFLLFSISLLICKFPYLHKIDNVCINFKKKTIKTEHDRKRLYILKTRSGTVDQLFLDQKNLKKFGDIIAKKHSKEENLNEKVKSLQVELKKLKLSLKIQHEELKSLITKVLDSK